MVKYEYRCKNCLSGFLCHINYILDGQRNILEIRRANVCKISDGAPDYIKPQDYGA